MLLAVLVNIDDIDDKPQTIIQLEPALVCEQCHHALPLHDLAYDAFGRYFRREPLICLYCKASIELWAQCSREVRIRHPWGIGPSMVGVSHTTVGFGLSPGERLTLRFEEHGVPPTAEIIAVHFTIFHPDGAELATMPAEVPTARMAARRRFGREIVVTGVSMGSDAGYTRMTASIEWHLAPDGDDGWSHLLDAWQSLNDGDPRGAIVPANVAAESSITPAVADVLQHVGGFGRERVQQFLADGATYGYQLSIMLPLAADMLRVPRLDDGIVAELTRLRKLRNEVGHTGRTKTPPPADEIASMIAGASFGFRYGQFLRATLLARRSPVPPG